MGGQTQRAADKMGEGKAKPQAAGASRLPHVLLILTVVACLGVTGLYYSGGLSAFRVALPNLGGAMKGVPGISAEHIAEMNLKFEALPPSEQPEAVLRWVNENFESKRWAQFTSFGPTGIVVTHMLKKMDLIPSRARILTIDTLHLFPETHELVERCTSFFGLGDVVQVRCADESKVGCNKQALIARCFGQVYRAKNLATRAEFEQNYGPRSWRVVGNVFDYVTKVEPTRRALEENGVQAWITGRRRSQGDARDSMAILEVDATDGRVKVNPMANWALEDVWKVVKREALPYNALHDQGYASVGDVVSTVKVAAGEDERAGRWKGLSKSECGMHVAADSGSLKDLEKTARRITEGYKWDQGAEARAAAAGVVKVTEETFENFVLGSAGNVLLEIYAPWCPHCQALEGAYNNLARKLAEQGGSGDQKAKVTLARMDGWQNQLPDAAAEAFKYGGYPALFLVRPSARLDPVKYEERGHALDDMAAWLTKHADSPEVCRSFTPAAA